MKFEYKKHDKALYAAKNEPTLIEVPTQNFICIKGFGNPNGADFKDKVNALYSLAYAIKMDYKKSKNALQNEFCDFVVYPLEGIWRLKNGAAESSVKLQKDDLEYTLMIAQPHFITAQMVGAVREKAKIKKPNSLYENIVFNSICDGKCVEILHTGPYDNEPVTFKKMDKFIAQNGLKRIGDTHREIYLNNPDKTSADKLKTILIYKVAS